MSATDANGIGLLDKWKGRKQLDTRANPRYHRGNLKEADTLEPNELAHLIVDLVSDKKGGDITLLDTRAGSMITDYLIIATGDSERQLKSIADDIQKQLKQHRVLPLGVEGKSESGWILLDYANVIVHLFSPAMRDFYLLEELHDHAPVVVRMP